MKIKICPKCKKSKSISSFAKCKSRKDGLQYYCRTCVSKEDKIYYRKNTDKLRKKARNYWKTRRDQKRNNDLKLKYGITSDDYNELLKIQNSVCAMCNTKPLEKHHRSNKPLPLAVDHNHNTGKVRGLLCRECNQALGSFEKHKNNIFKYLKQPSPIMQ